MANSKQDDVVHISPRLVTVLATTIMASLVSIAGYMFMWNRDDAAFKQTTMLKLDHLGDNLQEVKDVVKVVPANAERIQNLENRLKRVEADYDNGRRQR